MCVVAALAALPCSPEANAQTSPARPAGPRHGNDYGWSYRPRRAAAGVPMPAAASATNVQPPVTNRRPSGRSQPYGGNFAWGYSTPQTTYYNGPAYGVFGPFYYGPGGYGGGGGSNVQYFQRGRNAFWVETYRDDEGHLRQRTGLFFGGQ